MSAATGSPPANANLPAAQTIALFVDWSIEAYQTTLWQGVVAAAAAQDVNVIAYIGREVDSPVVFEKQANVIYDFVDRSQIHGIIFLSGLGDYIAKADFEAFCHRYQDLPAVMIADVVADVPAVLVDNETGFRDLLQHLISVHQFKRFAYIGGPESNFDARQRERVFRETLTGNGIDIDPDLMEHGVFSEASGRQAAERLLKTRAGRFEVIVAADDIMATGALAALQNAGVNVPETVALVGFDDDIDSRFLLPPLTTVRQELHELAFRAAELLISNMSGRPIPSQSVLPSRLVVRQSCGCASATVARAGSPGPADSTASSLNPLFQTRARQDVVAFFADPDHEVSGLKLPAIVELLEAFTGEFDGRAAFLPTLARLLRATTLAGGSAWAWQRVVSGLRPLLQPYFDSARSEGLWQQARVLIGEVAQQNEARRGRQTAARYQDLMVLIQSLTTSFTLNELMDMLAGDLPAIGIDEAYIALYEAPTESLEWVWLQLAFSAAGRQDLGPTGRRFRARALLPQLPAAPYSLGVYPLHFRDEQLGFMVLAADPAHGAFYESLVSQISSSLKRTLLLREVQAHTRGLEVVVASRTQDLARANEQLQREIEEHQQARAELESKNAELERFTYTVSHDLKSPLVTIKGFLGFLQRDITAGRMEKVQEDIRFIHSATGKMQVLLDELLELSRVGRIVHPSQYVPFSELAAEAVAMITGRITARRVTVHVEPDMPRVYVDRARVVEMLQNLVDNAAKFMGPQPKPVINIGTRHEAGETIFYVQDNGIGIDPRHHERVFGLFDRLDQDVDGTGIGLALAKRIVELHEGRIWIESTGPETGTAFCFTLPLTAPEQEGGS